ncbi:hypothetical protein AALA36_21215 [Lachnospiraceae bacterium 66-29]
MEDAQIVGLYWERDEHAIIESTTKTKRIKAVFCKNNKKPSAQPLSNAKCKKTRQRYGDNCNGRVK